jgi:hypothetical protein
MVPYDFPLCAVRNLHILWEARRFVLLASLLVLLLRVLAILLGALFLLVFPVGFLNGFPFDCRVRVRVGPHGAVGELSVTSDGLLSAH